MSLTKDDVQTWDRTKCESEMQDMLGKVDVIRKRYDGSLASITDPDDAKTVRELHEQVNVVGERIDVIAEQEKAAGDLDRWRERLETPQNGQVHPNGKGDRQQRERVDLRDAGSIFTDSPAFKRFREEGIKEMEAEIPIGGILPEYRSLDLKGFRHPQMKATLGTDDALVDVGTAYPPESVRTGLLVEELFQQPNIADLMPQATINQNAVPFMRETVNDQGAVETAEGALAPEASISFTEDSAPVRKIPVMLPVTEEILEDESLVRGHVNGRLPLFIRLREDNQLLNGDATGQNLEGILNLSGVDATTTYDVAAGASTAQDKLESIFSAGMRVMENFLVPDAVVMGLGLWEQIRVAKDTNNQYLIAPATDTATPRVWGWRIVTNQNMPAEPDPGAGGAGAGGRPILVGSFAQASQVWRRRAITVSVSDAHNDNFARGILVIKATTRLAVTHYRAAGYAVVETTDSTV